MRSRLAITLGLVCGIALGAAATLAIQSGGLPFERSHMEAPGGRPAVARTSTTPEAATTFLAWAPAGIPAGFAGDVSTLDGIRRVTVVAEDNAWLTRSWSADGDLVDHPRPPYMVPLDVAAARPGSFAPFLPPADRDLVVELRLGEGILGATSAELRGLGAGATLRFNGGSEVTIAGVVPDELVGAAELMVSKQEGRRIGVTHDRYVLVQRTGRRLPRSSRLAARMRSLLPTSISPPFRRVQVRAPGETPYFREGDAVLPPVLVKVVFGEFAARPDPARPGYLRIDPSWVHDHIVTATVPVLGKVTCNRALIPQLRDAMLAVRDRGLADTIKTYAGCYVPKFINRNPASLISHHAWGMAFDVNAATNPYGASPHQDPRLVRVLEQHGFIWGGSFLVPDGNHFEYRFSPSGA